MTQLIIAPGHKFKVLDHGYVSLIDSMGSDEKIVEAARMSTGKGFNGWEKDFSLLDFLWRNKHTSPFEMCEIAIEVQAPIMVFREWHRHRTQSYSEFSARYAQMENLHYLPEAGRIRTQGKMNKQSSDAPMDESFAMELIEDLRDEQEHIYGNYDQAIQKGVAKEIARINTPVSRYSKMRAKTDLLNWLRFLNLRLRPNAQSEIRDFAKAVASIVEGLFPKTWKLFEEYDLYGVHFGRSEMEALRGLLRGLEDVRGLATPNEPTKAALDALGLTGSKLTEFIAKVEVGGTRIL